MQSQDNSKDHFAKLFPKRLLVPEKKFIFNSKCGLATLGKSSENKYDQVNLDIKASNENEDLEIPETSIPRNVKTRMGEKRGFEKLCDDQMIKCIRMQANKIKLEDTHKAKMFSIKRRNGSTSQEYHENEDTSGIPELIENEENLNLNEQENDFFNSEFVQNDPPNSFKNLKEEKEIIKDQKKLIKKNLLNKLLGKTEAEIKQIKNMKKEIIEEDEESSTKNTKENINSSNNIKKKLPNKENCSIREVSKEKEIKKIKINAKINQLEAILYDNYICPISQTLFKDPVFAEDGQTYERDKINEWFACSDQSPITHEYLHSKELKPNYFVKTQIENIKSKIRTLKEKLKNL